ncbi:MAG: peptidase T [Bacteroidetes bacterium]|nr:peptidase T [Bacteroidota bacterium]
MTGYTYTVVDRFMRYVQVDTQSDPMSDTHPSSARQKDLAALLVRELIDMGISDAQMDAYGYVYATIPATSPKNVPLLCFCSHVDTAPDCSGTHVKPILHSSYNGADMVLPDDTTQVIRLSDHPYLKEHIGNSIITASGLTLLGADDKAGVAEIMDMAHYLVTHPEITHGTIRLLFTPDEEVGRGTAKLDLAKLGADYAYTLDGGELGTLEDETFSADGVVMEIQGVISHPGYAKGKMVNAMKIAGEILSALPQTEWSPETTDKKQGFVHPLRIGGSAEKAVLEFIVRDFDTQQLTVHENRLKQLAEKVLAAHPKATLHFSVQEQYRNMKEVLDQHPHIIQYAEEAYRRVGLTVIKEPIRGGTDGSRLSFMGLPCPNLFTGMQAIHSKQEWIGVRDMEKAVEMLVTLVQVWEEKAGV